jgi:hypothetical protein
MWKGPTRRDVCILVQHGKPQLRLLYKGEVEGEKRINYGKTLVTILFLVRRLCSYDHLRVILALYFHETLSLKTVGIDELIPRQLAPSVGIGIARSWCRWHHHHRPHQATQWKEVNKSNLIFSILFITLPPICLHMPTRSNRDDVREFPLPRRDSRFTSLFGPDFFWTIGGRAWILEILDTIHWLRRRGDFAVMLHQAWRQRETHWSTLRDHFRVNSWNRSASGHQLW